MTAGPYASAAHAYWHCGWRGILPLPSRRKKHPPKGFTGGDGVDPSYPDVQAWADGTEGEGNICLRMPPTAIGIDVDDYDDKVGGATIADAEKRWGPLPPTWRSTSRDDGTSGIRFYRVPEGLAWPHVVGDSVEVIRHSHRYSVVWPSLHPEGRTYRWINPDGIITTVIPDLDTLPTLPQEWVTGLTGGELAGDVRRDNVDDVSAGIWLATRNGATEKACARMTKAVTGAIDELAKPGTSAHDTACAATSRVIRLAAEGHSGLAGGLTDIRAAFFRNITNPRSGATRSQAAAVLEWRNLVTSGVNLVTANPSGTPSCDCDQQLTGLILGPATTRPDSDDPHNPNDPNADTRDHTTWWPRPLAGIIDGHDEEPAPTVLTRDDDINLFYPAKINGLLGESESGKTWIALLAVAQTLQAGHHVLYLDFEDTAPGIVARLRALGVSDPAMTLLHYTSPEETLNNAANLDLRETLDTTQPHLIVLDGFNAAMTLLGLDINDNGDATKFAQLLLRPLSRGGAAVVYVDHLPKDKDHRGKGGIGAQAKRAMTTGCALTVDVLAPFGRGHTGRLKLTVDKDRPGHVRAACAEAKQAGVAVLTSDKATGEVVIVIEAPDRATARERAEGRQLMLMETISDYLFTEPVRRSQRAVLEVIGGDRNRAIEAINRLVKDGLVRQEKTSSGYDHYLIRQFSVADFLANPQGCGGAADCGETVPAALSELSGYDGAAVPPLPTGGTTPLQSDSSPRRTIDGMIINSATGEVIS